MVFAALTAAGRETETGAPWGSAGMAAEWIRFGLAAHGCGPPAFLPSSPFPGAHFAHSPLAAESQQLGPSSSQSEGNSQQWLRVAAQVSVVPAAEGAGS